SLVLVDLEMPRMNGVELVRALRERPATRAVPVIMITSRSSAKHRQLALDAGVDVFLTKPYTEDALAAHIAELSGRR
ncbi:MAG TPA: response regulator, partial [Burkholderiaceae bacterium]|nr:response regulator [Burkholderiaceae bacterium]